MANSAIWLSNAVSKTPVISSENEDSNSTDGKTTDVHQEKSTKSVPFHVGDTVRVHYKLIEKEKEAGKTKRQVIVKTRERIQVFEGHVISIRGGQENTMFTVRRIGADAVGIERVFPLISPWIKKIEVKRLGDPRRAKLYYLRGRTGKSASYVREKIKKSKKTAKSNKKKSS